MFSTVFAGIFYLQSAKISLVLNKFQPLVFSLFRFLWFSVAREDCMKGNGWYDGLLTRANCSCDFSRISLSDFQSLLLHWHFHLLFNWKPIGSMLTFHIDAGESSTQNLSIVHMSASISNQYNCTFLFRITTGSCWIQWCRRNCQRML